MQLTTREALEVMRTLGVEFTECKHHVRGYMIVENIKLFPVFCSFGQKDLPGDVPHRFRRSLHLTEEEFSRVRSGNLGRDEYIGILRFKGVIHP